MRSFTRRTVATVAATTLCAGLFLTATPAFAATPTTPASTATVADHDDYDYDGAEVVAVVKGGIKVKLRTGAIVKLKVDSNCVILKGGVRVKLADISVGLKVRIRLAVHINLLGIEIKIRGLAGLIQIG